MSTTFNPHKPVCHRDKAPGWTFELLATDLSGEYPFLVKQISPDGLKNVSFFTRSGCKSLCEENNSDLINIPEKKLRPWKDISEVPSDAWFRMIKPETTRHWRRLLEVGDTGLSVSGYGYFHFESAMKCLEYTHDFKTILPCGVEEEA